MQLTFVSGKSTFLFNLINTRAYQSSYACIELSRYLNVGHMAFIVCVIGPGKISLICKIHFINGWLYYNYTHFHIDKVAIDGLFLM